MSRFLSEENINLVEEFISSQEPSGSMPNISETDREQTINDWKTINLPETLCTSYLQFASNANGMISYGFYKTMKNEIYIIEAYCSIIRKYYNIDNNWIVREKMFNKKLEVTKIKDDFVQKITNIL